MPALRPPPRRSVRLRALQTPSTRGQKAMEQLQGPVTRGRGSKGRGSRNSAGTGSDNTKIQIQWLSAPSRTQKVIDHLHNHQADCRILFYSDGKQSQGEGDRPSGKDKVSVCAVIAKYVFEDDDEYRDYYAAAPDKFRDSTNNHINGLRKKYRECHDRLHTTGAGVMPQDEGSAQNLHAQILKEFPWYDDLLSVMGGNPALSLRTVSSRPGVDHAAKYFSISSTAGSSYSDTLRSGSAQFGSQPHPPAGQPYPPASGGQPYPPANQPYPPASGGQSYPPANQPYPPMSGGQPYPPANQPYSPALGGQPYSPALGGQPYPPASGGQLYPPASGGQPYPPASGGQPHHPASGGQPYHPASGSQPFPPASGGQPFPPPGRHHDSPLDDDDDDTMPLDYDDDAMDFSFGDMRQPTPPPRHDYSTDPNVTILNSPPRSRRTPSKRPRPSSPPSSPITPPPAQDFVLPGTSQTSLRDSRASFGMADPKRRISTGSLKPPMSRRSSGSSRSKAASASSAPMSTSMTSPVSSSSTGNQKKKQRSDVQSRVDMLNAEIENVQSDKISREELKNERYMVKYNLARQVNEHKFLKHERADDYAEAAAAHIPEAKMHNALAHAHKEEATTLRLKIEYARLQGSSSGS
ncbi:hypothetical protein BD769DRAFT_1736720 [Suillus cothurnatus]|nr:hypothetical protein BD769DRAFT_1736720 [Suillus cothurnatus]